MSEFDTLVAELADGHAKFKKAFGKDDDDKEAKDAKPGEDEDGKDDKKVEAAAEDGKKQSDDDKDDDKKFGKAMSVADGLTMLKALQAHQGETHTVVEDVRKALGMALEFILDMQNVVRDQGDMLKALNGKFGQIASKGTGRQTLVSIAEKLTPLTQDGDMAKAAGPTPRDIMMKAQQMCKAGTLGWEAMPRIEAYQGRGQLAPPDLLVNFPELLRPLN